MFENLEVIAVLPAADMKRALDFYKNTFGFEPAETNDAGALFRMSGGTSFMVYETQNAGSAKNTQLCWMTDDLDRDMAELRSRGVTFADFDFPGLKTENGVAADDTERTAWFNDSEGNVLCIGQRL